jgi:hypothetical protein
MMMLKHDTCTILLTLLLCLVSGSAFTAVSPRPGMSRATKIYSDKTAKAAESYVEPGRNPNKPELPELKGDFDWDAKFAADDDWLTENVPGKVVLGELELAAQVTALDKLEEKWRKQRQSKEYDAARLLGWTEQAETYNGRYAMFFLVVGLLTEYWTGFSMPEQVEEMLRIGGIIGFEG